MRVWWRPIAVTHQVASSGSAPTAAIRLCEVAASAPGQPTTMLIRSGEGRTPRRCEVERRVDVPDLEGLDLERDAELGGARRDALGLVRQRREEVAAEVERARLDAAHVGPRLEAGRALLDRHAHGAAGRDHRDDVAGVADLVDRRLEQLGRGARRAVGLAHVQVRDARRRPRGRRRRRPRSPPACTAPPGCARASPRRRSGRRR